MDALLRRRAMIADGGNPTPPPTPTLVFYDRLVFDGTAYIDTDIVPDAEASYRMMFGDETLKASQTLFTVPAENSTRIGLVYGSSTTSTRRAFSVYYGASGAVRSDQTMLFSAARYTMMLTPLKVQFGQNGTAQSITKGSNAPSGPLIFGQNATHSGTAYTGSMGNQRVYGPDAKNATSYTDLLNNYTPTHTLRPCTYNGEAGFWCVETSKFYGNSASSGTLSVINNE